ncbi:MAG: hypothetical protein MRY21_06175 [Simkaniaceae bacterium]|nr:hypothetical protein [Simkaniaceae bacterium]
MNFALLGKIFNRALSKAFSKKKFLLLFPVLVVCGLSIVFSRALAYGASKWIKLSLVFLPVYVSSGVLLGVGILLARIYYREVKGLALRYRNVVRESAQLLIGVSYLSLPLLLAYLILWTLMGIFYLLKQMPAIGEVIGIVLSFAPFLLMLCTLLLGVLSFFVLFFATPHIALKDEIGISLGEEIISRLRADPFSNIVLFLMGILPLVIISLVLSLAAMMTGLNYAPTESLLTTSLLWFFIMLPFSALSTPGVIFFFNFATESHALLKKRAA